MLIVKHLAMGDLLYFGSWGRVCIIPVCSPHGNLPPTQESMQKVLKPWCLRLALSSSINYLSVWNTVNTHTHTTLTIPDRMEEINSILHIPVISYSSNGNSCGTMETQKACGFIYSMVWAVVPAVALGQITVIIDQVKFIFEIITQLLLHKQT